MSFQDILRPIREGFRRLNLPWPVLAASACLFVLCIGFGAWSLSSTHAGVTVVRDSESAGQERDGEAGSRDGDEPGGDAQDSSDAAGKPSRAGRSGGADSGDEGAEGSTASSAQIYVHVIGAVAFPGVYPLASGARAVDAVHAAGGFSEDAAEESINLAGALNDGQQLRVMTKEELEASASAAAGGAAAFPGASQQNLSPAPSAAVPAPVNINSATAEQLESVPGIGPATARAIIEDREAKGSFASVEDIKRVSGIGEKKFERMRDSICV